MLNVMNTIKGFVGRKASKLVLSAAALAGLAGSAAPAMAHESVAVSIRVGERCPDGYIDRQVKFFVPAVYRTETDRVWIEPVYQERCDKVWIEPVYQDRVEKIWIEPVYQERAERVWCEPVYQTRVEKILVPEVWEVREIRKYDSYTGRYVIVKERVLVRAAAYTTRENRVCVTQGHWDEKRVRVCVVQGHWEEKR